MNLSELRNKYQPTDDEWTNLTEDTKRFTEGLTKLLDLNERNEIILEELHSIKLERLSILHQVHYLGITFAEKFTFMLADILDIKN